jgi:hypothetical protein
MQQDELEAHIETMTDKEREAFKACVIRLALCFGKSPVGAVLVMHNHLSGLGEVMQLNCNEAEALQIVQSAEQYFKFITTKDAPPREKYN